jgi:hypothetical protein
MRIFLTAKLVLILAITASFIEPIFAAQADTTFRHHVKTEQEIAQEKKEREQNLIARLKEEDPLIYCMARNESTFNPKAINPNDSGSPSYGLLQFKKKTYIGECVYKYGFDYDGLMDVNNQIECAKKMVDDGLFIRWGKRTRVNCSQFI